jgi:hypothetical protein
MNKWRNVCKVAKKNKLVHSDPRVATIPATYMPMILVMEILQIRNAALKEE